MLDAPESEANHCISHGTERQQPSFVAAGTTIDAAVHELRHGALSTKAVSVGDRWIRIESFSGNLGSLCCLHDVHRTASRSGGIAGVIC